MFVCFSLNSHRAAHARDWDGESGYRIHISPLSPRTSRRDVEKIFSKFGPINEVNIRKKIHLIALEFYSGLDGDQSTMFCLCELQASS